MPAPPSGGRETGLSRRGTGLRGNVAMVATGVGMRVA